MNERYRTLYGKLVRAYYNQEFEKTFEKMLKEDFTDTHEAREILGALCGVEIGECEDDYMFVQTLIDAMTKQRVREKIVQKVSVCPKDCENKEGKSKCQSVCPFDAIVRKGKDKWIDENLCISCGKCVSACDAGNYMETLQFLPIASLLEEKKKVFAIVAPAISGQFGENVNLDQLREAFIKLGFTDMMEVAVAADILSLKEALEFNHHIKQEGDFMITSCCCPMWVAALRKVYNQVISNVSPSVSPMIAMARILKLLDPEVKVVFVGPCIAKKAEAKEKDLIGDVDAVLTFEELQVIFDTFNIQPQDLDGIPSIDYASKGGRLYARTGGVSEAVWDIVDQLFPEKRHLFSATQVDGMKDCKALLEELTEGKISASFIEGMGCKGGCVGGPKAIIKAEEGKRAVEKTAYDSAIKIPVHSEVLLGLLEKVGMKDLKDLTEEQSLFERTFE